MNESIYKELPLILSTTLYNYNQLDNRILAALKNYSFILRSTKEQLVVPADELLNILNVRFKKEINKAANYPQDRVVHGINTAFQLYHLINYYSEVKVVTINISMDKNYSKLIEVENGGKLIALDYKLDKVMVNYDVYLNNKELRLFNQLLKDIDIVTTIKPLSSYTLIMGDYLDKLADLGSYAKKKYKAILKLNKEIFPDKLRMDNPMLVIVTDHFKK